MMRLFVVLLVTLNLVRADTASAQKAHTEATIMLNGLLKSYIHQEHVDYRSLTGCDTVDLIRKLLQKVDLNSLNRDEVLSLYINAYNFFVIASVLDHYPVISVKEIPRFFTEKKHYIGNEAFSLDEIETMAMTWSNRDPRLHFVLVCGSLGCPRKVNRAIDARILDDQLEALTKKALSDRKIVKVNALKGTIEVSPIFLWYISDFESDTSNAASFIRKYSSLDLPDSYPLEYYDYDWTLNDLPTAEPGHERSDDGARRYVVSAVVPKKGIEIKLFNNLYTQVDARSRDEGYRSTYFTSQLSALYGVTSDFNMGFDIRYRRVHNTEGDRSPWLIFKENDHDFRSGITSIGPKIRWAPWKAWPGVSVQSAIWLPLGRELEGNSKKAFLDWQGMTWWTQFFYDGEFSQSWSLFLEFDLLMEDLGFDRTEDANRISTPATAILSYFTATGWTWYAMAGYSPYWQHSFDYFAQVGSGMKYQLSPQFEVELLYTYFTNKYLLEADGRASTFNLGFRYSR